MTPSITHLLPFYPLDSSTLSISDWFWLGMMGLFLFTIAAHQFYYWLRFNPAIGFIRRQIKELTFENAASKREQLFTQAEKSKKPGASLWLEFDESLVTTPEKDRVYNTLDAEHFFNGQSLAYGITSSRLLASAPAFLTAIGVLGTFVGLTMGLRELQINDADADALQAGISAMINGAAIAFMTSVWGVFLSLIANLAEKIVERHALRKIYALQHRIDRIFERLPAEKTLMEIAGHSKASTRALDELAEKIGSQLQETVESMSNDMQQAMTDALNNVMGPAMQSLVEGSQDQSSKALAGLVENFTESLQDAGQAQGAQLSSAATEVGEAVSAMSSQMDQVFTRLTEQQDSSQALVSRSNEQFSEQLTQQREDAEKRQAEMENRFNKLMEKLDQRLNDQFSNAAEQDSARQNQFEKLIAQMAEHQQNELTQQSAAAEQRERARSDAATEHERELQARFDSQLETLVNAQQDLMQSVSDGMLSVQRQMTQLTDQHQSLTESLSGVSEGAQRSSQHMQNSATQLGTLSTNLKGATEVLDQRVGETTNQLDKLTEHGQQMTELLFEQSEQLTPLRESIAQTTRELTDAATNARHGFSEMGDQQKIFLEGVSEEFNSLGHSLTRNVEDIEGQAEKWLSNYSEQVSKQVNDRMEEWNNNTREFANQMLRTVEALSSIIDDLENRE